MRRETIGSASHSAKLGSMSRSTTRKVKHNTIFPSADLDAGRNDSPKGVPIVQPYGFAYWPGKQDDDQQQQGQQQQAEGASAFENDDQPKGKSAIGLTSYANGSRSDPSVQNLQDPRHQLMLENPENSQQDYGGREGDTAMYHQRSKAIQLHFAGGKKDENDKDGVKPGAYLSTRADKNKIRLQLVAFQDDDQQQAKPQAATQATGGGAGAKGQQQQQQKKEGQNAILKNDSDTFVDIDGGSVTIRKGSCYVVLTGKHVTCYYESPEKSMRVDAEHTHIRHKDYRIWVDNAGCWSTVPVLTKQDDKDQ